MFPPRTRILIVDDMKTMRLLLRRLLTDLGFMQLSEAGDGDQAWNEALRALKAGTPYELILSDWIMPKTKGIHLLNRIRSNTQLKLVPFLMLTGENETEAIREAMAAGVNGYLLKPFTAEALRARLEETHAAFISGAKKTA
jgi:two-component system chemotaxis response regulator CheY